MKEEALGGGDDGGRTVKTDAERLREMQISIAASCSVFPGFRFSPTDDELISYYLKKKIQGSDSSVDIIPEVDFCRHEPWDLPAISIIQSDNEWFFFSARGRKYPNGSQSRRATQSGYWKATGKERNVKSGAATIGTKRTLVFHTGRAPKGERTEWIMHEYCATDASQDSLVVCRLRRNADFRSNESSRRSLDHRNLSAGDNSNLGMDGYVDTQRGIHEGTKEGTSSYTSHSADQNDSEFESERNLISDSPHGSSSQQMDRDHEDDCFADILKDDIIKLDESAPESVTTPAVLPVNKPLLVQETERQTMSTPQLLQETTRPHALPSQGTAVRRIRMRNAQIQHEKPSVGVSSSDAGQERPSQKEPPSCLAVAAGRHPLTSLVLAILVLLVLFLAWQDDHSTPCYKHHFSTCLEAPKRQLKFWLHRAADCL